MFDLMIIIWFVGFDKRNSNWISISGHIWTSRICYRNCAKITVWVQGSRVRIWLITIIFYLSLWFVFSVELTFIEFLEFSTFELDFASSGMTNEEPVLVVVGFGGIGSGSFGGFSSSSTKFSSFSTIIKSKSTSGILKWPPRHVALSDLWPVN